jgi:hypothetical protein
LGPSNAAPDAASNSTKSVLESAVVRRAAGCVTAFIDLGYAKPEPEAPAYVVLSISEAADIIMASSSRASAIPARIAGRCDQGLLPQGTDSRARIVANFGMKRAVERYADAASPMDEFVSEFNGACVGNVESGGTLWKAACEACGPTENDST